MRIGVRELRNQTAQVLAAVVTGERVTLTVRGEPVADIVPHGRRSRWLNGPLLATELGAKTADSALSAELSALAGQTLDEL
jgi:prevent-host-death family protein